MRGLRIAGIGKQLPELCVTNEMIAEQTDTSDEWIRTRTGIRTRYFCTQETQLELCVGAAKKAMEDAGVGPEEIGLCMVATLTADFVTPSAAALLQRELGLSSDIGAFDLNAACAGFVYGMQIAHSILNVAGTDRPYALLVGAERMSRIIDPKERGTYVLFGDGAAAAVLDLSKQHRFFSALGVQGDKDALYAPHGGNAEPWLHMDGKAVFRFAVASIEAGIKTLEVMSGIPASEVDYIVCHQANLRIIEHVQKKTGLRSAQFYMNLQRYGNTSAASIPLALSDMKDEGLLTEGTRVFLISFGSGLTKGSAYLEF